MPKLRTLSGREVRSILEAHGFTFVTQKGSHMKMRLEDADGNVIATVPVPVPDHKTLQSGTLSSIIRQSGLGRGPFEA